MLMIVTRCCPSKNVITDFSQTSHNCVISVMSGLISIVCHGFGTSQ